MRVVVAFIFACFISIHLEGVTVGSDTAVSKQQRVFFPTDETNSIIGFTVINDGITLEDLTTTCTYDAFFQVQGDMALNGGSLILNQNIEFKSPLQLGVAKFDGGGFAILFPDNLSLLKLPNEGHNRLVGLLDQKITDSSVNAVSWSWDDKYVLSASVVSSSAEVIVYYCADELLTQTATYETGKSVNDATFHPNLYLGALALTSTVDQLQTVSFDPLSNQITLLDTHTFMQNGMAVDWHPTGTWLAVSNNESITISLFPVDDEGQLGSSITGDLPANSLPSARALAWHSSGLYLAVGLKVHGISGEVQIFKFSGIDLTFAGSVEIGGDVHALDWRGDSLMLTVGHNATGDRLLSYLYNPATEQLAEVDTMQTGLQFEVFSVDWDASGHNLVVGIVNTENDNELITFHHHDEDDDLIRVAGYSTNVTIRSVAFPHATTTKIASADTAATRLFSYDLRFPHEYSITFKDAKLFLKSDVDIEGSLLFEGNCTLNGSNNTIDLRQTGSIIVADNSSVMIEEALLKGTIDENIHCVTDDSSITLRNTIWFQDGDFSFQKGSLFIQDDVVFRGSSQFDYRSSQPLIINSRSHLSFDSQFTFSYDPISFDPTLFQMVDNSSLLTLQNASLVSTFSGMQLTKGIITIENISSMKVSTALVDTGTSVQVIERGIALGNGVASDDCPLIITRGSSLTIEEGSLIYENTISTDLKLENDNSRLIIGSPGRLLLYETLQLLNGLTTFENNARLGILTGTSYIGSVDPRGRLYRQKLLKKE